MVFPDDERESNPASFKLLEMARKWKMAQVAGGSKGPSTTAPTAAGARLEGAARSSQPEGQEKPAEAMDEDEDSSSGSDED